MCHWRCPLAIAERLVPFLAHRCVDFDDRWLKRHISRKDLCCSEWFTVYLFLILADRTNGRAYAAVLRPFVDVVCRRL